MSGPLRTEDVPPDADRPTDVEPPVVELTPSREAAVGPLCESCAPCPAGRARTVGAWCFVDHMVPPVAPRAGVVPTDPGANGRLGIGPHPHIGLQTATWLLAGELVHTDSLGSEQVIRPGQLNLMTAGRGVAHAEEDPDSSPGPHGVQLWVAQPEATRHGDPAFEHHAELPHVELGSAVATVLVGGLAGVDSPARRDTDHVGADLALYAGTATVPLVPGHEHALVALDGAVRVGGEGGTVVTPGHLAYLGIGRDELAVTADGPARVLLIGGVPFPEQLVMWWNFVARSHDEVSAARDAWQSGVARFGPVASSLARIPAPPTPWARPPS